ncbi:MAG: ABC transporter substrate-binding protein [Thermodesulfobacteriota bacterium]
MRTFFRLYAVVALFFLILASPALAKVTGFPHARAIEQFPFDNLLIVFDQGADARGQASSLAKAVAAKTGSAPRVVSAGQVSARDKDRANLILLGGPQQNMLLNQVIGGAPAGLQISAAYPGAGNGIIGVYYNPFLGSERDVLVVAGGDEAGTRVAAKALEGFLTGRLSLSKLDYPSLPRAMTFKFAHTAGVPMTDTYVLFDKGFLKEELSYYNVTGVKRLPMAGGTRIIQVVAAGEVHGGMSGTGPPIFNSALRGVPLKYFAGGSYGVYPDHPRLPLITVPRTGIKKVEQVRGKTIAINTYANIMHMLLNEALEMHGIDPKEVRMVEMPFPAMVGALGTGKIDVAFEVASLYGLAKKKFKAFDLLWDADIRKEGLMVAGYFMRASLAAQRPELLNGFLKAIVKSIRWQQAHLEEATDILTNPKNTRTRKAALKSQLPMVFYNRDGELFIHSLKKDMESSIKYGFIPKNVNKEELLSKVVDPEPLKKVWRELGIDKPKIWGPWKYTDPGPWRR